MSKQIALFAAVAMAASQAAASVRHTADRAGRVIGDLMPDGSVKIAAAGGLTMLGASAHAALPEAVTTAIAAAGTDMTTAITNIITAFVVFWGLKKLASKFGWI